MFQIPLTAFLAPSPLDRFFYVLNRKTHLKAVLALEVPLLSTGVTK